MSAARTNPPRARRGYRASLCLCAVLLASISRPLGGAGAPTGLDPWKPLSQLALDTWTTDQGLPNASVPAVLQDQEGYVWVGTYDGLARFNGTSFTVFDQSHGLGNNGIRALALDRYGDVWAGTNGGGVARFSKGSFQLFTEEQGLPSEIVWSLLPDAQTGGVFIGTRGGGLARYQNGRMERFPVADSGRSVYAMAQSVNGTLWLGAQEDGLRRRSADGTWTAFTRADGLPDGLVTGVAVDADGVLWGGSTTGLFQIRDGQIVELPPGLAALRSANVTTIHADPSGAVWVGTNGSGLARCARGEVSFLGSGAGLGDAVSALAFDRAGALWIGTSGAGVSRLRDGSFTSYLARDGPSGDLSYAAFQDRAGTIWMGGTGGLHRLEGSRLVAATPPEPVVVRSIAEDGDGALWIGTYGHGAWRLLDGRWQKTGATDGLASDFVRALAVDPAGKLWAATLGGLSVLESPASRSPARAAWRTYRVADGLPADSLIGLAVATDGALWAGTDGSGVVRFHEGRFTTFTTHDGLPSNVVLSLLAGSDGALWIGTNGGLALFQGGSFTSFAKAPKPLRDSVTQILDDGAGSLWIGSSRGVARVSKSELSLFTKSPDQAPAVVVFDKADGMKSAQCTAAGQPGALRGRDGRLWFATTRGVASVNPSRLSPDDTGVPVIIEDISVDGAHVSHGLVVVKRSAIRLDFTFSVLSLIAPERSAVRFRLEGLDSGWQDGRGRRHAVYTNLPPGDYVFRAAASNRMGVWSEASVAIPVRVDPHPWETPVFRVLAGLSLLAFVIVGHRVRVASLSRRERQLEALVAERTTSLEAEKARADAARVEAERLLAERTLAQRDLARSESRYRDLFERSLGLLCTHDLHGTLLSVNPAVAEALGRSEDDLVGRPLSLLVPQELRPRFAQYLAAIRRDRAAAGTLVLLTASGERRTWRFRNVLREGDSGGVPFVIGFAQDVTEEEAFQAALRESERRFRQFAENIDAVISIRSVDPPAALFVNAAFERIWGRPVPATIEGVLETIHPEDREAFLAAQAKQREGYDLEFRILRPDGSMRWIHSRTFPIKGEKGEELVAGIAEDVSARKAVEQMRDDMTHTLVHDLRNPLNAILGGLGLLEMLLEGGDPEQIEMVLLAKKGALRLLEMVNALLDVSRLEGGAMPLDRVPVSLHELASEVLELEQPLALPGDLQLLNEVPPDLPPAFVDRAIVSRVLQNLVGNAIKFTPRNGHIRVRAEVRSPERAEPQEQISPDARGEVEVHVADDGHGLPDDVRTRLFEKFATGRQQGTGTGLGLRFCRLAVEAHGGRIWVESSPAGATFKFALPLSSSH